MKEGWERYVVRHRRRAVEGGKCRERQAGAAKKEEWQETAGDAAEQRGRGRLGGRHGEWCPAVPPGLQERERQSMRVQNHPPPVESVQQRGGGAAWSDDRHELRGVV